MAKRSSPSVPEITRRDFLFHAAALSGAPALLSGRAMTQARPLIASVRAVAGAWSR